MLRRANICCLFLLTLGVSVDLNRGAIGKDHEPAIQWVDDYQAALATAAERSQFALVWFYDPATSDRNSRFESDVLSQSLIADAIAEGCVAVKLPVDAKSAAEDSQLKLLDHPAFGD